MQTECAVRHRLKLTVYQAIKSTDIIRHVYYCKEHHICVSKYSQISLDIPLETFSLFNFYSIKILNINWFCAFHLVLVNRIINK